MRQRIALQEMSSLMELSHRQQGPIGSLINLVSDNHLVSPDQASHRRKSNTTASSYKVDPSGVMKLPTQNNPY
ncbi:Rho-related GTP-binding protein Rho6 [Clarias magur]|uniref:Rho-related GTP-binding protein Rho6 n=1 Tax=Clarias magur TaxID=1594786 RepID=A0A8J4TM65_CLAMG|nr:Rho-related GTP-binding protein Rho6 [Clarias magur]